MPTGGAAGACAQGAPDKCGEVKERLRSAQPLREYPTPRPPPPGLSDQQAIVLAQIQGLIRSRGAGGVGRDRSK